MERKEARQVSSLRASQGVPVDGVARSLASRIESNRIGRRRRGRGKRRGEEHEQEQRLASLRSAKSIRRVPPTWLTWELSELMLSIRSVCLFLLSSRMAGFQWLAGSATGEGGKGQSPSSIPARRGPRRSSD